MYSRIGGCIQFFDLNDEQKIQIIDNWYNNVLRTLNNTEK